ncbi:hypothetical protein LCGC14_2286050 [marine sediment metagenome]|uniref:Uncharacterized protein n=1 Tax=marine sediment metagenome TaxID=412755 RepID=A0A0F9DF44_9ZZZZ
MLGTHAILQSQCPLCYGAFAIGDYVVMMVVDIGPNGCMIEYVHESCKKDEGEH